MATNSAHSEIKLLRVIQVNNCGNSDKEFMKIPKKYMFYRQKTNMRLANPAKLHNQFYEKVGQVL